jgi:ribosomal protein L37AE/L43A
MDQAFLLLVREKLTRAVLQPYEDSLGSKYQWDSTVPNSKLPQTGDVALVWSEHGSRGASVIEAIEIASESKSSPECPRCHRKQVRERVKLEPRYYCAAQDCKHQFDEPHWSDRVVTTYTSELSPGWVDLSGRLTASQCRQLAIKKNSQHSIRPADLDLISAVLRKLDSKQSAPFNDRRNAAHGFATVTVRARLGQGTFRESLLDQFGPTCAFTGDAPKQSLDAAHLYSYAKLGEHHDSGGLLLRSDIHRLFDAGLITVDPLTLTIDLHDSLLAYPIYRDLQGQSVKVALNSKHLDWLSIHRRQYFGT